MPAVNNRDTIERFWQALVAQDHDVLESCYHPDVVVRYPQSGEVFRGRDRYMAMLRAFPGMPSAEAEELLGDERVTVIPSSTPFGPPLVTVTGGDELFVGHSILTYPDDGHYHNVSVFNVKNGLIVSETSYFAKAFEPPAWRAEFCEYE